MAKRRKPTKAEKAALADSSPRPSIPLNPIARAAAKRKIVRLLKKHGTISMACIGASITRRTYYEWLNSDPQFNADATEAIELSIDVLEIEARRRAEKGVKRPVYQGGRLVGYTREHSDRLMELMLKAKRPEQYNPKPETNHYQQTNVQITQAVNQGAPGPVPVLSEERRAELEYLQRIASGADLVTTPQPKPAVDFAQIESKPEAPEA